MLIMTRREGESIIIDGNIKVTVTAIGGPRSNQVKIGVEAPKHIEVHREEIYDRIQKEQASA